LLKLIIGNRAYSSWSMRGWLAVKQSGEEFEEYVVPMFDEDWEKRREGDEFAPSLGKVPILWDGECVVWDSLAIIEFLADRNGRDLYWPEDETARGMARSMAAEMHSGFSNLRRNTFDFLVWPLQELVENAELVHDLERRRMDSVAPEIAQEITMFFEYRDIDASAPKPPKAMMAALMRFFIAFHSVSPLPLREAPRR